MASGARKTTPQRGHSLKKPPRKIILRQWNDWAHLPKADEAARRTPRQQRRITKRPQRSATKTPKLLSSAWNVLTSLRTSAGISLRRSASQGRCQQGKDDV